MENIDYTNYMNITYFVRLMEQMGFPLELRPVLKYMMDITILDKGAARVANAYPWESAGWFWTVFKGLNEKVAGGYTVEQTTEVINGGLARLEDRIHAYERAVTAIP